MDISASTASSPHRDLLRKGLVHTMADTTTRAHPEKLWSKDYLFIVLSCLTTAISGHLFFATLPIYVQTLTGTAAYAGVVTGVYTLSALVMRPVVGSLVERWTRRRVLLIGAVLVLVSCVLYGVVGGLVAFLLARALHGVGFSACTTSTGAAAVDVVPSSRLAEGLGYYGLSPTLAAAVAPALALTIIGDGALERFDSLFLVGVVAAVISLAFGLAVTYERRRPAVRRARASARRPGGFLGFEAAQFWPGLVLLLVALGHSSVLSFVALFAMERGLGNAGSFFTLYAIGTLLSRGLLGRVADRRGANVVIVPGLVLAAATLGLVGQAQSLGFLLVIAGPMGFALGAITTTLNTVLVKVSSPGAVGSATAAYYSSMDLGYGAGAIGCGWLIASRGYEFVYASASVLCVAALAVYLAFVLGKVRAVHGAVATARPDSLSEEARTAGAA